MGHSITTFIYQLLKLNTMAKTNIYTFDWEKMICKKNNQKFGDIVEHDDEKMQVMVTNKKSKAFGEIMTFVIIKNVEQ